MPQSLTYKGMLRCWLEQCYHLNIVVNQKTFWTRPVL